MPDPPKNAPRRIRTAEELGAAVRAARKKNELDQETTADLVGVGARFLGELERGKDTVRLGLVLRVLERLGLEIWISPRGRKQ